MGKKTKPKILPSPTCKHPVSKEQSSYQNSQHRHRCQGNNDGLISMKRMRRIWKQTRWGLFNCKFERIDTIKQWEEKCTLDYQTSHILFPSKSRDGKRADQPKTSWAHIHQHLCPGFPCPGASRKWFFFLAGKAQHSHTRPSWCSPHLLSVP